MDANPLLVTHRCEIRERVLAEQAQGRVVGVVMTMGALHAGHISLVAACNKHCDVTIVTIFVNPAQFLPGEDLKKYPRNLDRDLELLRDYSVDAVFAPTASEMYPLGFSTFIEPPTTAVPLEGQFRPGHFRGVCTVVFKLLQAVPATIAWFGHKDYQQYVVLRQMAHDLDLAVDIRVQPTVREADGLALSSRNQYLSSEERKRALAISRGLHAIQSRVRQGGRQSSELIAHVQNELTASGIEQWDYVAVVDADTLESVDEIDQPAVALVATHVGTTRLIDNIRLDPKT